MSLLLSLIEVEDGRCAGRGCTTPATCGLSVKEFLEAC